MKNEVPPFDLLKALRELDADPLSPRWRASLERALSDETAERYGISPMPGRVYIDLQQRDLTTANLGAVVGTTSRDTFIGGLQGASIALRLGAQRIDMGADNLLLPVITTPPTAHWLAGEDAQIPETQPVIASRAAVAKTIGALVKFSHQLARSSSPAVERVLVSELGRAVGAALDGAIFNGTGANGEPLGILNTAGITSASGASVTWAKVLQLIADVTDAGAAMVGPGFAATGAVLKTLLSKEISAGGAPFTQDATKLAGLPLFASKTGPAGALVFGDWANLAIVNWGVLELLVDPFSGFKTGAISMRAMLHVDTLLAHPEAFSALLGVS